VSNATNIVIWARGLKKSFVSGDRSIDVLNNVDFRLNAGESISIRGESGSGKTTLLNVLSGLEKADDGLIEWGRYNLKYLGLNDQAKLRATFLGMVFQSFYLIPELNALENVLMSARIIGRITREHRQRANELLGNVGLAERTKHLPLKLSGGERQRVALARALFNLPRVIFADEPTGNLDEKTGAVVIDLLLNLCQEEGVSLVLVTHNKEHANRTSRQLLLRDGRLETIESDDEKN
jgi:predicted ABC-type transport system involved in lysophospholipase L1 biosynthesis ATPase subunit